MEAVPVRKKKRYAVLAVLSAAVALVVLAPYVLSSSPVLGFAVRAIEERIPGTLSIESWLVSWQQGILCQQVVYADPHRGIRCSIPRLSSTRGLLQLLLAPNNLGLLILEGPQIEIRQAEPDSAAKAVPARGKASPGLIPFWNHLSAELEVRGGQVTLTPTDPALAPGLRDVSLSAALDSGVVNLTLAAHSLHDQGAAKVTASLNLPAMGGGWLQTMVADGQLKVTGMHIRDLLALAGKEFSQLPGGDGLANMDLRFKAVGLEGLEVSGLAEVAALTLQGGFLGEDAPSLAKLRLNVDGGRWSGQGWSVREFDVVCEAVELHGSGRHGPDGLTLAGKGRVNLPVLFSQFPHLLRLREGTKVEGGAMDFSVDLALAGNKQLLDLKLRADGISGQAEGGEFAWSDPVAVLVNMARAKDEFQVHAFKVEAPFLRLDGRGDPQAFVLDALADLNQASGDLGQIFTFNWDMAGQLDLAVKGREDSADAHVFKVDADLQITDFALNNREAQVVPRHDFSLLGSASLPLSRVKDGELDTELQLALTSWLGETFITLTGDNQEGGPFRSYYSTDTSLDLASATGLLHSLGVLPGSATVDGDMQIQAAGYLRPGELEIRDFTGEIGNLALARDGASFADRQVRLEISHSINDEIRVLTAHNLIVVDSREKFFRTGAGSNVINFADHSLFLHNLSLSSATGAFKLAELLIPDWRTPLAGLAGGVNGSFDLAQVSSLLRSAAMVDGNADLAGSGHLSLRAEATEQGGQQISGKLDLADVSLVRQKKTTPLSRVLRLGVQLARQDQAGDIDIKELRLDSDPLKMDGTGALRRGDVWRKVELQGRVTPVLEQLSPVLRDGFGIDLTLAGGQSEAFLAQFPLAGKAEDSGAASLVTSLHADRLEYGGIAIRSLHMPVSLENRVLRLEVTGQVGEGRVEFIADTDLAADPAVVTVPANSQILTGVPVAKPLVDTLLSSLHPLFGVLTSPTGQLDLRLNTLSWPLGPGEGKAAEFEAVADLRDLSLESTKMFKDILSLFALDKEKIEAADGELVCVAGKGRITCTPFTFRAGGEDIAVNGSMGLNGSLDFVLEVPVTRKLVSEEGYRFLQGASIRVPLRGTVKAPSFDRDKTLAGIKDLLNQAAKSLMDEKRKERSSSGENSAGAGNKG